MSKEEFSKDFTIKIYSEIVKSAVFSKKDWKNWVTKSKCIEQFHFRRCMKSDNFGKVVNVTFFFFDALELAYGQCSFIRIVNETGRAHRSLLKVKNCS